MHFNHIHVRVRDLPAAVAWMRDVWKVDPDFENDRMASLPLGSFWLFLDCADEDTTATVGFETDDCDRDFKAGEHEPPIFKGRDDCDSSSSKPLLKPQPDNGMQLSASRCS